MAIELVSALNGSGVVQATGNTYVLVDEADTYFDSRRNTEAWTGTQNDDEKDAALLWAMETLDSYRFIGAPLSETQPLAWPRVATNPMERGRGVNRVRTGYETLTGASGLYDRKGRLWVSTAIPTPIKNAQCEIALWLLATNPAPGQTSRRVKSWSGDGTSVTYEYDGAAGGTPDNVLLLLKPFLTGAEMLRG